LVETNANIFYKKSDNIILILWRDKY
jgi:hypothetical protein